ncbi:hypothetical protein H2198_002554 [Neophaeococcomyces mojaviensis]|uniref:Uncharacterized protein n=1 Tax=Neophaeococcomyces mojaviensis TaxID=3383035 RepID=A0ACC3ADW0_9EURO|nr:hypothetical protein H2198_002554 [Knufia sp. JES_112]
MSAILARLAPSSSILLRSYASTTKGDQPNATNLGTPSPKPSDSATEGDVKSSRATDSRAPQESGTGLARPVSEASEGTKQADEEGGDPTKKDPNKPAEQKKAETLKGGEKALDAADNQSTSEQMAKAKEGGAAR